MRIMDWSSDVCSSDLAAGGCVHVVKDRRVRHPCTDRRRAVPLQVVMRAPARKIELGFDPGKLKAIRRPAAPAPRLTKDRLLDTKDVRRGGHVASLGHRSDLGNAVESPAGSLAFGNAKRCYCFST